MAILSASLQGRIDLRSSICSRWRGGELSACEPCGPVIFGLGGGKGTRCFRAACFVCASAINLSDATALNWAKCFASGCCPALRERPLRLADVDLNSSGARRWSLWEPPFARARKKASKDAFRLPRVLSSGPSLNVGYCRFWRDGRLRIGQAERGTATAAPPVRGCP